MPYHLLKCDRKKSVGDPDAENLLVQGDNLFALKALLPYYAGKVKCIYIDPPYNTGNEGWVYNDNVNSPQIKEWLGKTVGKEAEDLSRHDKWLCMMYPRLKLLREFLSEDGVIFVSIDEFEHRYLMLMLDEIFGSRNRIETFVWKKTYGGGSKSRHVVNLHEYAECFCRDIDKLEDLELPPNEKVLKYYKYEDNKKSKRGPYRLQPLATNSMDWRPNLRFAIPYQGEDIWPEKQWQWSEEHVRQALADDELVFKKAKDKWTVNYKQYLRDEEGKTRTSKPYSIVEGLYTQQGTKALKVLLGDGKAFDFPKPPSLIKHFVQIATIHHGDAIILDSFAGSGTTGQAVLELNREDGGNRRCILVEMEESIATDVTALRLAKVIEQDNARDDEGFRYCTLGQPLFDADGQIREHVNFSDLAQHVFFTETNTPLPKRPRKNCPLIGTHSGVAYYLLFNGVLGDKRANSGNVLTRAILEECQSPKGFGHRVIYGEANRLHKNTLQREGVTFKQLPYEVETS